MAQPTTETLDIPARGLPAEYITAGVTIDTMTLDVPSRTYLFNVILAPTGGVRVFCDEGPVY